MELTVSYDEITRYKQSVVQSDADDKPPIYSNSFTQWSGDNVDHNVNTLDGLGSLHGMCIIAMSSPFERLKYNTLGVKIPRLQDKSGQCC